MKLILGIEVFVFVFAVLILIKNLYNIVKIIRLKDGKVDNTMLGQLSIASAISYIITMLIIGF